MIASFLLLAACSGSQSDVKTVAPLVGPDKEIAARIFGVNSWSILVPQALMGVASVGLLYLAVRRWAGADAGLSARVGVV